MGLRAGSFRPSVRPARAELSESLYLDDARYALAALLGIAVDGYGLDGQDVVDAFVVSGVAREFERMNPAFVSGMSGIELVGLLLPVLGERVELGDSYDLFDRGPGYWLGWSLVYFQVATGVAYGRVFRTVPYCELAGMYRPLHEAPEEKFVEVLSERLLPRERVSAAGDKAPGNPTPLRRYRERAGLSQAELARESGTGLRSIQMYEQRNRDIGRARAVDVLRMARVLGCEAADLVED